MTEEIRKKLTDIYGEELIFADGFDDAIVGVAGGHDSQRVVYCYGSMVEACMKEAGMIYEDAVEWIEYNTMGSYVGRHTPIYVIGIEDD